LVILAQNLKKECLFDQGLADATNAIILDSRSAAAYSIRAEYRIAIGDREGATEGVQKMHGNNTETSGSPAAAAWGSTSSRRMACIATRSNASLNVVTRRTISMSGCWRRTWSAQALSLSKLEWH
jgi:hypothetical protein